jgi:hypothetical protein
MSEQGGLADELRWLRRLSSHQAHLQLGIRRTE